MKIHAPLDRLVCSKFNLVPRVLSSTGAKLERTLGTRLFLINNPSSQVSFSPYLFNYLPVLFSN